MRNDVGLVKRSAVLLLLVCLGCSAQSAQSAAPSEANRRFERLIRANYHVPPEVEIKLGDRKASEFNGYDVLPVTLTRGNSSHAYEFYVSKDDKKLIQMVTLKDPMDQIDMTGRPMRGSKDAKVTVLVYDDFECPFCARNHQALFQNLAKDYGDKVKVVYKDYPLFEIHPWAAHAAIDSGCLAAQSNDAYWNFADYVHSNQAEITGKGRPLPDQFAALDKLANDFGEKSGLNAPSLQACIKAQDATKLNASVKEAEALGVNATPTMFINGQKLDGAVPEPQLRAILDRALLDEGVTPPASPQVSQR